MKALYPLVTQAGWPRPPRRRRAEKPRRDLPIFRDRDAAWRRCVRRPCAGSAGSARILVEGCCEESRQRLDTTALVPFAALARFGPTPQGTGSEAVFQPLLDLLDFIGIHVRSFAHYCVQQITSCSAFRIEENHKTLLLVAQSPNPRMRDVVHGMLVFTKVVQGGSLSAAARELGISPAVVSRTLAAMEARLGVRLINRTTRSLHLTDEGASYYETSSRILAEIEKPTPPRPRRVVRKACSVALPASFGLNHIAPLIPRFAERYENRTRAVALGPLDQSDRRRLRPGDPHRRAEGFVAGRAQARAQPPRGVREPCLPAPARGAAEPPGPGEAQLPGHHLGAGIRHDLGLQEPRRQARFRARHRALCLRQLGSAADVGGRGLGVALKSTWDVRKHLEDGSLVPLLPGYDFSSDVGIYAVYPHRRHLPAKTRVFIDFLAESFGPEPYWDQPAGNPRIGRAKASAAV